MLRGTRAAGRPNQAGKSNSARRAPRPIRGWAVYVTPLAVAALVFVARWPALNARALCFDDEEYLVRNRLVRHPGWSSAQEFLTEVLEPSTVHGYYQPL